MKNLGIILLLIGLAIVIIYAGYHFIIGFLLASNIPVILRIAVTVMILGVIFILIALISERVKEKDKFKGVER